MARIAGVDIPREKRVVISLTYIYGIGITTSKQILAAANVSEDTRVRDLSNDELDRIRAEVDKTKNWRWLRREVNLNIKRLMEIGSYRGVRHRRGLPVRGQNTKIMLVLVKAQLRLLQVRKNNLEKIEGIKENIFSDGEFTFELKKWCSW